jgi:glycosyltransferase involved in cell wall biosynthesis
MKQTLVIGHVALIQKLKKQHFTLEVIKTLRAIGYDAVGVFAGECREPEYMNYLEKKTQEYGLDNFVLLIIPSAFEGFPLAGLEAASAGVPVAACKVAGAEEFILQSGDGACFAEDDVNEAVAAVQNILANRMNMTIAGKVFAEKNKIPAYKSAIHKVFQLTKEV